MNMVALSSLKPSGNGFVTPGGQTVATEQPGLRAALTALSEAWPLALPVEELCKRGAPTNPEEVATMLLNFYAVGGATLLGLWGHLPSYAGRPSERPVVWPIARWMAKGTNRATGLRHETVNLDQIDRQILPLLDGSHSRSMLRDRLVELFRKGELTVNREGTVAKDEHQARRHQRRSHAKAQPLRGIGVAHQLTRHTAPQSRKCQRRRSKKCRRWRFRL
jgi:hypothetical protein